MTLAVTTQAAGLEDWLDVLDEIDATHLLEHDSLRPLGPGGDPLLQGIGLILVEQLPLGRHHLIGIGGKNRGRVERAVLRFSGHHHLAVLATFQQPFMGVQLKFPLGFLLPMTTQAGRLEHRLHLLFKGHLGLGQAAKCTHRSPSCQQTTEIHSHHKKAGNVRAERANVNRRFSGWSSAWPGGVRSTRESGCGRQ